MSQAAADQSVSQTRGNDWPRVTVILPVYNGGDLLAPAVRSILDQTYPAHEVLLVDDGSTDGAVEKLGIEPGPKFRIVRQANAGKASAMNAAIDTMTGDAFAIMDADDLSHPQRLEKLAAAMRDDPSLGAVFSSHHLILGDKTVARQFKGKDTAACRQDIELFRMPAHDPTAMYRRDAVGDERFEPSLSVGEGYDFILRIGERHPMAVVGEPLYGYRVTPGSLTRSKVQRRRECEMEVFRRACSRRGIDSTGFEKFAAERDARPLTHRDLDNKLSTHFLESVGDLCRLGGVDHRIEALGNGLRCARLHPLTPAYYKPLVLASVPYAWHGRLRQKARNERSGQVGPWGMKAGLWEMNKLDADAVTA
ncbi:MAG: glycosyltransferase family A protein [Planctomycetota bacterium]